MTTTEVTFNPANVITKHGHVALTVLATHLMANLEILKNEDTGDEIASFLFTDTTDDGEVEVEVHIMPNPYCRQGIGWVAVSNGQEIAAAPSVSGVVKCYRDWRRSRATKHEQA